MVVKRFMNGAGPRGGHCFWLSANTDWNQAKWTNPHIDVAFLYGIDKVGIAVCLGDDPGRFLM